jgi:hypothetical protein
MSYPKAVTAEEVPDVISALAQYPSLPYDYDSHGISGIHDIHGLHGFFPTTPSPFISVANPALRNRFATSSGTSRPLVSLFGVPV